MTTKTTTFQVGDKVVVREDLMEHKTYGGRDGATNTAVDDMLALKGKVVTISSIRNGQYRIEEGQYNWTEGMFAGALVTKDFYDIGDKVLVRDDLVDGKIYGNASFEDGMSPLLGQVATIKEVDGDSDYQLEGSIYYYWTNDMIVGSIVSLDKLSKEEEEEKVEVSEVEETKIKTTPIDDVHDLTEGDKVLIRTDLETGDYYGTTIYSEMLEHQGKVATIEYIYGDEDVDLDVDEEENFWNVEMFVGKVVEDETELKTEEDADDEFDEDDFLFFTDETVDEGLVDSFEEVEEEVKEEVAEPVMKYKVGDKVKIRTDLIVDSPFAGKSKIYSNEEGRPNGEDIVSIRMLEYQGKELEIAQITPNNKYSLKGAEGVERYVFVDEMIEGLVVPKISETHTVNQMATFGLHVERVIFSEPATIMFYRVPDINLSTGLVEGMSSTKKVVAKCSPEDTFDKQQGMSVCLLRAMRKEADKQLAKI